jgi:thiol-disulfide isomerase/thioredoxin
MFKKRNFLSNSIWIIGIALVVCNIFLIVQNLKLRSQIETLSSNPKIQTGENFSEFNAVDIEDNAVIFSSAKLKKVILFTSTTCPYCKKQNPYWTQLLNQIDSQKYEIVELFNAAEERQVVSDYLKSIGHSADPKLKVVFSNSEDLQKYKLNVTPTTLVLNENGTVEKVWSGLWDKSKTDDVNSFFNSTIQ